MENILVAGANGTTGKKISVIAKFFQKNLNILTQLQWLEKRSKFLILKLKM